MSRKVKIRSLDYRQAEVIENSSLKHLIRFSPDQSLLLYYLAIVIFPSIMRIKDQKLTLTELPIIMHSHNTISILTTAVHDRAAGCQEVVFELLTFLHDPLAIRNMKYFAV
jgi:hypothetical protein